MDRPTILSPKQYEQLKKLGRLPKHFEVAEHLEIVEKPEVRNLTFEEQKERGMPKRGDILIIAGIRWECIMSDRLKWRMTLRRKADD